MTTSDTALLKAQLHELRVFKDKFKHMFEHIPAFVTAANGRISQINSAAEQLLCISAAAITGKTLFKCGFKVMDELSRPLTIRRQPWSVAAKGNTLIPNTTLHLIFPDGQHRWFQGVSMPFHRTSTGRTLSSITVLNDITAHRQMQSQALQSQRMDAIGSLVGGLTHDFNNILSSILSAAQWLLLNRDPESPEYETLKDIENQTLRGSELIKQLMLFNRPAGPAAACTHLHTCLQAMSRIFKHALPKSIHIEMNLPKDEIMTKLHQVGLEQIMMNIVLNARDAMPAGGTLKITATPVVLGKDSAMLPPNCKPGTYARIEIADTGTGIPPDILPKIFDPFVTSKGRDKGTGLGMAIVYTLVTQARGHIFVDSTSPRGTTFVVMLPASRTCRKAACHVTKNTESLGGSETILVVDDEPIITKSTARFLERYGYKTLTAYDGKSAMTCFQQHMHKIQLVVMDMEMPVLSGKDCITGMLGLNPKVRIIAMSGHLIRPGEWHPVQAGATAFCQKPFDSDSLLSLIRKTLNTPVRTFPPPSPEDTAAPTKKTCAAPASTPLPEGVILSPVQTHPPPPSSC